MRSAVTPEQLAGLRARLVAYLRSRGDLRTARVAAAFERVPRHLFVPQVSPEEAYADRSIAIKLDDGVPISSSSQPAIMAEMLELLAPREGDRVLEIGTGSGYNAALLGELTGPAGFVESIDLDPELVAAAAARLSELGYAQVRTVCGDGAHGDPAGARSDAVIATVGVERIPPAWIAQLRLGGRLVAPLTLRSMQKVVAFERTEHGLRSIAVVDAGFMMLRGPSATFDTRLIAIGDPTLALRVLCGNEVDAGAIERSLRERPLEAATARRVRVDEVWNGLTLWLALHEETFCRITAHGPNPSRGFVPNLASGGASQYGFATTVGSCAGSELVLFAPRNAHDVALRGYGPSGGGIARLQHAIENWDDAGRPGNADLRITVDLDGTTHAALSPRYQ